MIEQEIYEASVSLWFKTAPNNKPGGHPGKMGQAGGDLGHWDERVNIIESAIVHLVESLEHMATKANQKQMLEAADRLREHGRHMEAEVRRRFSGT